MTHGYDQKRENVNHCNHLLFPKLNIMVYKSRIVKVYLKGEYDIEDVIFYRIALDRHTKFVGHNNNYLLTKSISVFSDM